MFPGFAVIHPICNTETALLEIHDGVCACCRVFFAIWRFYTERMNGWIFFKGYMWPNVDTKHTKMWCLYLYKGLPLFYLTILSIRDIHIRFKYLSVLFAFRMIMSDCLIFFHFGYCPRMFPNPTSHDRCPFPPGSPFLSRHPHMAVLLPRHNPFCQFKHQVAILVPIPHLNPNRPDKLSECLNPATLHHRKHALVQTKRLSYGARFSQFWVQLLGPVLGEKSKNGVGKIWTHFSTFAPDFFAFA